ncbi:MAG: hypothetical protein Q4A29_01155 [Eubacteriales bacterium]|nr:hypothetical protein [Eubacteriales bacterium]
MKKKMIVLLSLLALIFSACSTGEKNPNLLYESYSDYFVVEEMRGKEDGNEEVQVLLEEEEQVVEVHPAMLENGIAFMPDKMNGLDQGTVRLNPDSGHKIKHTVNWQGKEIAFDLYMGEVGNGGIGINIPADGKAYKVKLGKGLVLQRFRVDYFKNGQYKNSRYYDKIEIDRLSVDAYLVNGQDPEEPEHFSLQDKERMEQMVEEVEACAFQGIEVDKPVMADIEKLPLTDTAKKHLLSLTALRPTFSQWIMEIGKSPKGVSFEEVLKASKTQRERLIKEHSDSWDTHFKGENAELYSVSKPYSKGKLAYLFVKVNYPFSHIRITKAKEPLTYEWLEVEDANIYRAYLFQKVDEELKIQEIREISELKTENMSGEAKAGLDTQVDRFLRSYGEKAEFIVQ